MNPNEIKTGLLKNATPNIVEQTATSVTIQMPKYRTYNDVKKALEFYGKEIPLCIGCNRKKNLAFDCIMQTCKNALAYINHLEAENKRLTTLNHILETDKNSLESLNSTLYNRCDTFEAEVERLNTENRILSQKRFNIFERLEFADKIRADAIKAFAERLKEIYRTHEGLECVIDNLVKETTGDEK